MVVALIYGATSTGHSMQVLPDFEKADKQTVRLPASKFPELPPSIRSELDRRGCGIPQVWRAIKPANVIEGSFIRVGQVDWAVLCSVHRISSILIFPNSTSGHVIEIGREADVDKLQGVGADKIGYSARFLRLDAISFSSKLKLMAAQGLHPSTIWESMMPLSGRHQWSIIFITGSG